MVEILAPSFSVFVGRSSVPRALIRDHSRVNDLVLLQALQKVAHSRLSSDRAEQPRGEEKTGKFRSRHVSRALIEISIGFSGYPKLARHARSLADVVIAMKAASSQTRYSHFISPVRNAFETPRHIDADATILSRSNIFNVSRFIT